MDATTEWLLEGPPWVQYRTRVDLLKQSEKSTQVVAARAAMLAHPQVKALIKGLAGWPVQVISILATPQFDKKELTDTGTCLK